MACACMTFAIQNDISQMEQVWSDILTDVIHYESTKFHPEFKPTSCSRLLHYNTGQITS